MRICAKAVPKDFLGKIAAAPGAKRADFNHPTIRQGQKACLDVLLASFCSGRRSRVGKMGHWNKYQTDDSEQKKNFRVDLMRGGWG